MHSNPVSTSVAVIGAGPSGLAAARKLIETGFNVTVLERRAGPGGTWLYDPRSPEKVRVSPFRLHDAGPQSTASELEVSAENGAPRMSWYPGACYQSLMTNVKTPLMKFETFEYPDQTPWFVPHHTILRYLEGFSKYAGVDSVTRYNTNVARIKKEGDRGWKLLTQDIRCNDQAQDTYHATRDENFDNVVVCTGHFDMPYIPPLIGLGEWYSKWPESILHSKEYRSNEAFKNKTVLIVGAGSSAYDIGREVASEAYKVYQIVRKKSSGPWSKAVNSIVPENMIPMPEIVAFGSIEGIRFPKDGKIMLKDGSFLTGLEVIIFCTGYRFSLPFLPDYQAYEAGENQTIGQHTLITDGTKLYNLHKDMFFIPEPTLAFIGVPFATFPFLEIQADTIAAVFSGHVALPSKEQMHNEYAEKELKRGSGGELYTLSVDGELEYVRQTQTWSTNPSDLLKLRQYERVLKDAESVFPEALSKYLRTTRILQGINGAEIERIIASKVQEFKSALAGAN